ncbi:RNA polymerase sigma factor [Halovulum sp. GXIMD14793]
MSETEQFRREIIALLPRLRRFARTLTRDAADADDLAQDVCMKALSNRAQWDPDKPLDRWLFRITRNHWFSELRKRKVRTGEGVVDAAETGELQVEAQDETKVLMGEVNAGIAALPSELSSVLMLVCAEGYSYREVADLMEIPIGTVMSRIHRARKTLADGLRIAEQVTS